MRRRAHAHDDLFEMFPDLPRPGRHSVEDKRARVLDLVAAARERVADNARRQREAAQRVRDAIVARRRTLSLYRRGSSIS